MTPIHRPKDLNPHNLQASSTRVNDKATARHSYRPCLWRYRIAVYARKIFATRIEAEEYAFRALKRWKQLLGASPSAQEAVVPEPAQGRLL